VLETRKESRQQSGTLTPHKSPSSSCLSSSFPSLSSSSPSKTTRLEEETKKNQTSFSVFYSL